MPVRVAVLALALAAVTGCQQTLPSADLQAAGRSDSAKLPPTLARMQQTYADLHTGRFVCLANFNTRPQANLLRTLGPDGSESKQQPTISVRRSVNETGAGGLEARLTSPNDQLIFDGVRSDKLALVRDWREYNLLLLNIHGPPGGVMLELTVESGDDVPMRWTRNLLAKSDWHLYRFDLAEIGEDVDLADVRSIRWRAPDVTKPVDLYLDDLILTDNTHHLLGTETTESELYLFTRGRRIHVGVRGRFELAFSDGVIVEWHANGGPNLTVRSGLGPWPLPLPSDWSSRRATPIVYDDPALFANWGTRIEASQQLVEKSGFRVVIEGHWRFVGTPGGDADDPAAAPAHHWRYVIYPSGQVHVRVTSRTGPALWSDERVGYAIVLDGRSGFLRESPESTLGESAGAGFVLMPQPGRSRPDLLWCPYEPESVARQLELVSADQRRVAVTVGDVESAETVDTFHLLRFWPCDIDGVPEGQSFAADYRRPGAMDVLRGHPVTDAPGDADHDGYNESEGCYELMPADGLLRLRFLPGLLVRYEPVFRVHATAGTTCWVYADGHIIDRRGRDQDGNLLFALPHPVSTPVTIEVNTGSTSTLP